MGSPAPIDIVGDRNVPLVQSYEFLSNDLASAAFTMHVRQFKDTSGTPLLSLTNAAAGSTGINLAYAGTDTIANHVSAGRLVGAGPESIYLVTNPSTGNLFQPSDSATLSKVVITVLTNFMQALPTGTEVGDDVVLYYDLISDTPSGNPEVLMAGKFTVRAGVTIP